MRVKGKFNSYKEEEPSETSQTSDAMAKAASLLDEANQEERTGFKIGQASNNQRKPIPQ